MDYRLGLTCGFIFIAIISVSAYNHATYEEDFQVGNQKVFYECQGLELVTCIGFYSLNFESIELSNESVEPDSEKYFREVEMILMRRGYEVCSEENLSGMDWLNKVEYDLRTAGTWNNMDKIRLLSCEHAYLFA